MSNDKSQRFMIPGQNWRGELVYLTQSYQTIMQQHGYPLAIAQLLGEALLAAGLMASSLKFTGQLTLQFTSDGPIEMLVAKATDTLNIRGLAKWSPSASDHELAAGLRAGQLVMTLEQPNSDPYQSIIPVETGSVGVALERYFLLSEQLPSTFKFCVNETTATGLLLQMMPSAEQSLDKHAWADAKKNIQALPTDLLFSQVTHDVLTPLEMFGEIRLFEPRDVQFHCPCSIARMERALMLMPKQDIDEIFTTKPVLDVTCEYCNHSYGFSRDEILMIMSSPSCKDDQQAPL